MAHHTALTHGLPSAATLSTVLETASQLTVGILGDYMLDHYILGEVDRISPEAPVPVLRMTEERFAPGGAANVAANITSLGARCECFGVIGRDWQGEKLNSLLQTLTPNTFLISSDQPTVLKTRVVARKQQIVRIDRDPSATTTTSPLTQKKLLEQLVTRLSQLQCLILSDYGKGLTSAAFLESFWDACKSAKTPCYVDPKHLNFSLYRGCTAITPNAREASLATNIAITDDKTTELAAEKIHALTDAKLIIITRGEQGMSVFEQGSAALHLPALSREVFDVTGAGDTVIATFALGKAAGLTTLEAARLATLSASIVVGHFGAAACTQKELRERFQEHQREIRS